MEERKRTFIAFLDDDNKKKEDWVEVIHKHLNYIEFIYRGKIVLIPWHRILKVKEETPENGN